MTDTSKDMAEAGLVQNHQARQNGIESFAFVIAAFVCVSFCICLTVPSLVGFDKRREISLEEKINPNDAPLVSLVRLPGIGIGRAGAIVAYREQFTRQNDDREPFEKLDDLQKVKGIGPKTAKNISKWLKIEK